MDIHQRPGGYVWRVVEPNVWGSIVSIKAYDHPNDQSNDDIEHRTFSPQLPITSARFLDKWLASRHLRDLSLNGIPNQGRITCQTTVHRN